MRGLHKADNRDEDEGGGNPNAGGAEGAPLQRHEEEVRLKIWNSQMISSCACAIVPLAFQPPVCQVFGVVRREVVFPVVQHVRLHVPEVFQGFAGVSEHVHDHLVQQRLAEGEAKVLQGWIGLVRLLFVVVFSGAE